LQLPRFSTKVLHGVLSQGKDISSYHGNFHTMYSTVLLLRFKLKLKLIYDWQSVCLGIRRPSGTRDQFFFLLEISFRQLWFCYFVAPSLMREQVCNLLVQVLLGLARAVTLGSKSCRTHGHILRSHLRLPQLRGPGPHIYIPWEQGGPVIPPGTGFPFCRLLWLAGLGWRYSNPPPHEFKI
jgi:hypothetical protein